MFLLILLGIPVLSLLWFFWAMRTSAFRQAGRTTRISFSLATSLLLGGFVWIVLQRMGRVTSEPPAVVQAAVLLWGLVFLPLVALPTLILGGGLQAVSRLKNHLRSRKGDHPVALPDPGRRRFLETAAVALPVLATYGATGVAIPQTKHFRIRRIDVPLAGLPKDLDGMTIAHVSDVHVGKFTHGRLLTDLAEATNQLKADVVALTGDLIDHALADLPEALDMVSRFDPRSGLFLVEGNHDLFEGREAFRSGVREAGLTLLANDSASLEVRGHPIDVLGIPWAHAEARMEQDIATVARLRRQDAFPILLAHHPHAFDAAARAGIPLTLGGHTHGGQLMITPEIGPGPMLYRYWSGLYQKPGGEAAVISNGAGNWFPLRTAAPAEILYLTLRRVRA
ncbi:metallophosphoesterase [Haloferula luteola]|nr:metallophosphoesterase [Haloferula luteola]